MFFSQERLPPINAGDKIHCRYENWIIAGSLFGPPSVNASRLKYLAEHLDDWDLDKLYCVSNPCYILLRGSDGISIDLSLLRFRTCRSIVGLSGSSSQPSWLLISFGKQLMQYTSYFLDAL